MTHRPRLSALQQIVLGYVVIILAGALLLQLPAASADGRSQPFLDTLFCATSAVTTTGLTVVDIGSAYSLFGELVILVLFQIGGLGYMLLLAGILTGLGGRLSLNSRVLLRESMARPPRVDMLTYGKFIVGLTLAVELTGTLGLAWLFSADYPAPEALYSGFFHAVSAFCTAGFGLYADSLSGFRQSAAIQLVIYVLMGLGALGFLVIHDLVAVRKRGAGGGRKKLSLQSRLVIKTSLGLAVAGTILVWLGHRPLPTAGVPLGQQGLDAAFQALSAATTTGFYTLDIGSLPTATLWVLIVLMFIGASPGGSGGGIKTLSMALLWVYLRDHLAGRADTVAGGSKISPLLLNKVLALVSLAFLWTILATGILLFTEEAELAGLLFEVVSALGTVGLSTGLTPDLTPFGKSLILLTMLAGRIGPLVLGYSLFRCNKKERYSYPEADLVLG
ncbi:MAG: TrkH family potassium uptake protein [Desulfuromonadales bacterium]